MHDYDRRFASTETTETLDSYWPLDVDKIVERALKEHSARLADYKYSQISDYVVGVTGTAVDGRTFEAEVTIFIKGAMIWTNTKMKLEGMVSMGPVPGALLKMEASVSNILTILKEAGFNDHNVKRFTEHFENFVAPLIESWRRGEIVDKQTLRSRLRDSVKRFDAIPNEMGLPVRMTIPPGETLPLWKLVDAARKTFAGATREVK